MRPDPRHEREMLLGPIGEPAAVTPGPTDGAKAFAVAMAVVVALLFVAAVVADHHQRKTAERVARPSSSPSAADPGLGAQPLTD